MIRLEPPPLPHLFLFAVGLGVAYIARRALRDAPEGSAAEPLPLLVALGGAGICLTGWGLLPAETAYPLGTGMLILFGWFLAGRRVPALRRLNWLVLLGCCMWVAGGGIRLESMKVPFAEKFVPLSNLSLPLTVVWLWVVAYVIACPAQAEETATGLCSIIAAVFLGISLMQGDFMGPLPSLLSAAVLGCCLGVMLGSTGKLTARAGPAGRAMLGLVLATISVVGALKNTAFLVLVIPFLLLGLPLMDATYVLVSGRRSGDSREAPPADSGRSVALGRESYSLHGYLLALGMTREQVARLFYLATAYLGGVAILLVVLIEVHFLLKLSLLAVLVPGGFLVFYIVHKMLSPVSGEKAVVEMFGIPVANITAQETLERIAEFISSQQPHHVVTSDSLMLLRAQQDGEFRRILERADLVTPDGTGVVLAGRLLGQPLRERVSGVDLVERISQLAAERSFSVYLLGGQPGVAEEAAEVLRQRYSGLEVRGTQHGYFSREEEPDIVAEIAGLRPDVLFVGLGAPRQEKWITVNLHRLGVPVCIGVGGTFDVISGRLARAPAWVQRCGLEWLYRAVKEPKRLPRLLGLPRFMLMTLKSLGASIRERDGR